MVGGQERMSGITRIQKSRESARDSRSRLEDGPERKEIWLKDGDQAFLTSVATGEENDTLLDDIYLYIYRVANRWINVLQDERVDTGNVPEDVRPSHKFAFWAYIYNVIHTEKRNDSWEEVEGPGGRKMFKEEINDFRVISLGFGRSDYVWNQLVDIHSDWGALNKGVIRIKRTGAGAYDTSYTLAATPKKDEIPSDREVDSLKLEPVKEYFFARYGNAPPSEEKTAEDTSSSLF